ncbi:Cytochrome c-551 [Paenibacillus plantiphilus]|uniref:Cytochrome c-551 n=2 Tax=Paenibacillus plantiphilus TaxID=2905650 RepID=A0ABN8GHJ4_9BACL|nr:Cytochrome c-551 [Paenibacillus plantiphilus]
MKHRWLGWILFLCVIGSLVGCGNDQATKGRTTDGAELTVPPVYKQNCLSCHGSELQGRVGPNLQTVGGRLTEEQLSQIIREGKGGMPGFENRLDTEEIGTLSAWLAAQK